MGNRLQLAAATPVFAGRVSLLFGYRAGKLGRAWTWQIVVVCVWRHYIKRPGSTSGEAPHEEKKLKIGRSGRMRKQSASERETETDKR